MNISSLTAHNRHLEENNGKLSSIGCPLSTWLAAESDESLLSSFQDGGMWYA